MARKEKGKVRVRIAPSPTGYLHLGTGRTALFNWLYAKHHESEFILRIEDTDRERSEKKYEDDIFSGLAWLGLDYDEGPLPDGGDKGPHAPYRQSQRTSLYRQHLESMLLAGSAYYCFCKKDELDTERQSLEAQGLAPVYSGRCRSLSQAEAVTRLANGESAVIRCKVPNQKLVFEDLIRGKIEFDLKLIGDIVIAKNLENPLYNFAVVVDDASMLITHVIRGEDHIANTPKQIVIQQALGLPKVHYAHLPLILDPDRSKMSKRYSAVAVSSYRKEGYLPEAIMNFMALLGWHPEGDKELMPLNELIAEFDLGRIQKAGAVFNAEKLDWMNGQYLRKLSDREILQKIKTISDQSEKKNKLTEAQELKIVNLLKSRLKKLSEFSELTGFFYELPSYNSELLLWKEMSSKETRDVLRIIISSVEKMDQEINKSSAEQALAPIVAQWGRGEVLWPLRAALSGEKSSPGPYEIMEVLGKTETLNRLQKAVEKITS